MRPIFNVELNISDKGVAYKAEIDDKFIRREDFEKIRIEMVELVSQMFGGDELGGGEVTLSPLKGEK